MIRIVTRQTVLIEHRNIRTGRITYRTIQRRVWSASENMWTPCNLYEFRYNGKRQYASYVNGVLVSSEFQQSTAYEYKLVA